MSDNEIPRVLDVQRADGQGYHLTGAQQDRKKRGVSIWNRDKVVEPYEVRKGKFV